MVVKRERASSGNPCSAPLYPRTVLYIGNAGIDTERDAFAIAKTLNP